MTSALFETIRLLPAVALLLTVAVGLGWAGWLALVYLGNFGRQRPRLVANRRHAAPRREPTRPRSDLAWRHGRNDLRDHDAEPPAD